MSRLSPTKPSLIQRCIALRYPRPRFAVRPVTRKKPGAPFETARTEIMATYHAVGKVWSCTTGFAGVDTAALAMKAFAGIAADDVYVSVPPGRDLFGGLGYQIRAGGHVWVAVAPVSAKERQKLRVGLLIVGRAEVPAVRETKQQREERQDAELKAWGKMVDRRRDAIPTTLAEYQEGTQ